jgi:hypothetical protein
MAACKSVKEWLLPAKPLLIVRYLGTTPDSSSLAPLLTSICQQVQTSHVHTWCSKAFCSYPDIKQKSIPGANPTTFEFTAITPAL